MGGSGGRGGGGGGRRMGQSKYSPMENSRLPWRESERPGRSLAQQMALKSGDVALVLLVSHEDSEDCCAMNYERTVFRDGKVIKYAKKSLLPFRYSRSAPFGRKFYSKFDLDSSKPALLVIDGDGDLLYKKQKCLEPRDCLRTMMTAVVKSKKKISYSEKAKKKIEQAEKFMKKKNYRKALSTLGAIKSEKVVVPLRSKIDKRLNWLERVGKKKLKRAKKYEKKGDLDRAREIYKDVARSFGRIDKIKRYARAGLKRIKELEKESPSVAAGA